MERRFRRVGGWRFGEYVEGGGVSGGGVRIFCYR